MTEPKTEPQTVATEINAVASRIADYAATVVTAPQLLIIIVATPEVAAYRSNIVGGAAALPAVLHELADKMHERIPGAVPR